MNLEIRSVFGPAWVQDLGRPGHMHEGMPWGGALVPELAMAANIAVGNPVSEPVIEFFGALAVKTSKPLAQDGKRIRADTAQPLRPPAGQRVSYLAVAGGIRVPSVMGGFGTFPAGQLGGFNGRALQRGDVLSLGPQVIAEMPGRGQLAAPAFTAAVDVFPGPDRDCFSAADWKLFLATEWKLKAPSDRSGTRLSGPALQPQTNAAAESTPMVMGAIQVPPDGQPIVLGPDHPVTGGYPVLAVVARAALGRLQGRVIGAGVRFQLASPSVFSR